MKPVHILGWGFVIGAVALGVMAAAMAYQWQAVTFPETSAGPAQKQPAGVPGGPISEEASQGKTVFAQKCGSCHTIGGGKLVGPDLAGITTQRPHDWLVSFITTPDKVIASGDPTAQQLVKEYGMPMPNVGATTAEAEQILAYIDYQSGVGGSASAGAAPSQATTAPTAGATPSQASAAPATASTPAATTPTPQTAAPATAAPTGAAAAPAGAATSGDAARGQTIFSQKCASCHSIGGGRMAGPDLKGVTSNRPHDWLVNFIVAPDKVIASGDPTAQQLVKEYGMPMPNLGVSNADAQAILAYIAQQSGGAPGAAAAPAAAPTLPPGNAGGGQALFTGERRFSKGGPACIACHNVAGIGVLRGGTWGLDLTHAESKTGAAGLASIMKSPPFPGMTEAFASHPLTDNEIADLLAFFAEVDGRQESVSQGYLLPLLGVIALVIFLGFALFASRNRSRSQGVRRQLVGGNYR